MRIGKEPTYTPLNSDQTELARGLYYYTESFDANESKKHALDWLRENHPHIHSKVSSVPSQRFLNRGYLCRMMSRGFDLDSNQMKTLLNFFEDLTLIPKTPKNSVPPAVVVQPEVPVRVTTRNMVMYSLDECIDSIMKKERVEPIRLSVTMKDNLEARDYLNSILKEIEECPEGYLEHTAKGLKELSREFKIQLASLERSLIKNKQRTVKKALELKAAKPKPLKIVVDKKEPEIECSKGIPELGVKGLRSTVIAGASHLWVYDTQDKAILTFVAADPVIGMCLKGMTLHGQDRNQGVRKYVKPEVFFSELNTKSLSAIDERIASLRGKGSPSLSMRLSTRHVILGVK